MAEGVGSVPPLDILEAGLRSVFARGDGPAPVVKQRERNVYTSQFATELVTIEMGGSELVLLCKHGKDFTDHVTGLRRGVRYETSVYDIALRALAVDAPRFYGCFAGAHGRTLVLEFVREASRVHHSDAARTAIVDAAAQLGAMHARGEALVGRPSLSFVNRYDREHLRAWPHRVERLIRIPALSELLRPLATGAARITRVLAEAKETVIHGELYPSNVLVAVGRISFVDWETAGVGPGEIDLATLTVGNWEDEIRRRCQSAYADSRWPSGPPPEFDAVLAASRLHVLMMLAAHRRPDPDRLASERWVAEQIAEAADRLGIR
jgi:hypothetical protein